MTFERGPKVRFEVDRSDLRAAMIILNDLDIRRSSESFEEYEKELFEEIRSQLTLESVKDDPIFRSYRDLYWTFGMDPTKQRVSSEAVLRRILKGLNLWRISNIVDIINLASAYHKIPIGLVDVAKLNGDLVIRTAFKGEVFQRIGGKSIVCRGREIVVADDEKIVCFGYATHDSEYTMVTKASRNALVLLYGSAAVSEMVLNEAIKITNDMIDQWLDCKVSEPMIFSSST
ncbi:MAG: B3/4 domain-containing protein [Promethearchaeota archaeon]